MGTMFEWRCGRCGAGERFSCGGGMMYVNEPEVIRKAREGGFGPAMAMLLGNGVPDGWHVFRSRVYYRCPECDTTFEGMKLVVNDRSDGTLTYAASPGPCPICGQEPPQRGTHGRGRGVREMHVPQEGRLPRVREPGGVGRLWQLGLGARIVRDMDGVFHLAAGAVAPHALDAAPSPDGVWVRGWTLTPSLAAT